MNRRLRRRSNAVDPGRFEKVDRPEIRVKPNGAVYKITVGRDDLKQSETEPTRPRQGCQRRQRQDRIPTTRFVVLSYRFCS